MLTAPVAAAFISKAAALRARVSGGWGLARTAAAGRRSGGGTSPVENAFSGYDPMLAKALPGESDDCGDGSVQVYALNIGEDRFDAIIAAIIERPFGVGDEEPRRVVYGTAWVFEGGRWMVQSNLTAFVLGEELLDVAQPVYPNWERYESP